MQQKVTELQNKESSVYNMAQDKVCHHAIRPFGITPGPLGSHRALWKHTGPLGSRGLGLEFAKLCSGFEAALPQQTAEDDARQAREELEVLFFLTKLTCEKGIIR